MISAFRAISAILARARGVPGAARRYIVDIMEARESAYVELGPEGEARHVSPAACVRLGYPLSALVGRNIASFLHTEDRDQVIGAVRALWRGELDDGAVLSCRMRTRDGAWITLETKFYLARDAARRPVGAIAALRDVTRQRVAERNLECREALLSAVSEVSGVGGWEWRPGEDAVFCTPVARRIMGAGEDDEPSFSFFISCLDPSDRPRVEAAIEAALDHGAPWSLDLRATVRGGLRRVLRLTGGRLLRDGVPALIGGVQDVTEDERARSALERAMDDADRMRQRLIDAVEAMPDGFALYDAQDRLVLSNARFREIHRRWGARIAPGATFESMLRARIAAGDMPEARGREDDWIAARAAQRRPGAVTERRTADGLWLRVVDRETSEGGVVSLRIDMTEQKQQENWLALALDAAEEAAEAKSQFLATMSHEIRTPLNGVIGMLELMAGDELPPEQRRRARIASDSAAQLLELLNDLLDYSRLEAGRLELESIPVRLSPLAEGVAALFEEQAAAKGIALRCALDPGLPDWVAADPLRLRQVAQNLLSNAVKFTERGAIELALRWAPGADGAGSLRIEVSDSGVGVPEEARARLFQRFSQADEGVARRYGGTGLGLAICRQIVTRMGGRIALERSSTAGSVFAAEIPLRACPPPHGVAKTAGAASPQPDIVLALSDDAQAARVAGALRDVAPCRQARNLAALGALAREGGVAVCLVEPYIADRAAQLLRAAPGAEPVVVLFDAAVGPEALRAQADAALRRADAARDVEAEFRRLLDEMSAPEMAKEAV